jgi:sulfate adenylyltransferase subunit 1 (EFTu-like GTPase family)
MEEESELGRRCNKMLKLHHGPKVMYPEAEERVLEWVKKRRRLKLNVSPEAVSVVLKREFEVMRGILFLYRFKNG